MRDVVALHSPQVGGQAEFLLKLSHGGLDHVYVIQPLHPVMGQSLGGVGRHHVNELLVLTALGKDQPHRSPAQILQPLTDQFFLFKRMLEQDSGRYRRGRLVKLLDELAQHQSRGIVLGPFHEKVVPADELVVADEKHLDPGFVFSLSQGDDVHVADRVGVDLDALLLGHALHTAHPVTQHGGSLEFQAFRRLLHVLLQVLVDRLGVPFHEQDHLLDHLGVVLLGGVAGTRSDATVDEELQAGTGVFAGNRFGTRPVGEEPFYQVHGLADGACGGEGAEVSRSIVGDPPSDVHPWKLFRKVYLEVGVGFVVFKPGVISGFVALDQGVFQDERFGFTVGDNALEVVQMT